jgi:molecular chaperone DnaK
MVKDAESHAAEDKKRRELVELRNQTEALIHGTEKSLTENASIPAVAAIKDEVESAISTAKTAIAGEDAEAIKSATTALTQVAMKIGEAVYTAKGGAAGAEGEEPTAEKSADGDDVVDADFEEVKDDKKKSA